jgi:hypothetical protein
MYYLLVQPFEREDDTEMWLCKAGELIPEGAEVGFVYPNTAPTKPEVRGLVKAITWVSGENSDTAKLVRMAFSSCGSTDVVVCPVVSRYWSTAVLEAEELPDE